MGNYLAIIPKPQTVSEAMQMAKMISTSSFAPKGMQNRPGDILLAWQLGAELGLSLMQSLQNIAVINGKPSLFGDAALAVVQSHPHYKNHREWFEGDITAGSRTAFCGITRSGSEEHIVSFSINDAKKAGLWGKAGVWQQYPDRMLQMRARGFCIRDKFADALRGIITREEAEDYPVHVQEVRAQNPIVNFSSPGLSIDASFDFSRVESCETLTDLKNLYAELKEQCKEYPDHYKILNGLVQDHKKYLEEKLIKDFHDETQSVPASDPVSAAVSEG